MLRIVSLAAVVLSAFGLTGCGVTNQLHSELNYGAGSGAVAIDQSGIGVLTPAAPTGKESDKQTLGDSVGGALEAGLPGAHVVSLAQVLSSINKAGLAGSYATMLEDYDHTGILDRQGLRDIGEAAGVRYLAKLNLGGFDQSSDKRLSIAGIRMFDTWRAVIRVHLEIWDSETGEIAWQGNEELTFAREGVKERPVSFRTVADLAAENLVAKVGESGSETIDEVPEELAALAR